MLNVIYDATLLANSFNKNSSRSGLYVVARNVLDYMLQRDDLHVSMYFSPENFAEGFRVWQKLYSTVDCAQNVNSYKRIGSLYCTMWEIHGKLYSHSVLRKPFALVIAIVQRLLKFVVEDKVNSNVFSAANVFFSPAFRIPDVVRKYPRIRSFVTLHDAIPFLFPTLSESSIARETCENLITSDGIFFVSNHTKKDFERIIPNVNRCRRCVVPLAASDNFIKKNTKLALEYVKEKYGIPKGKKFVFSLCSLAPHKNLIRNLRCFSLFVIKNHIEDLIWIVGGGTFEKFTKDLKENGINFNSTCTKHIGYVDDDDLPVLYSNAEWFVYTSQYEGFGLPPLEAMQCGCPVIVSNNSSLPEVVGNAGILIDWDSDEQHVAAYEKYYFDEKLRRENIQKGLERAKMFSWEKTVNEIVRVMKESL